MTQPPILPGLPFDSPQTRKQLAKVFTHTLAQQSELRMLWLIAVYRINPNAQLPYHEIDGWFWALVKHTRSDTAEFAMAQFMKWLSQLAPAWTPIVTAPSGQAWLMNLAEECARGRYRNPCRPLDERGRRPGSGDFWDDQAFLKIVVRLIQLCDNKGLPPSQPRIAVWLKMYLEGRETPDDETSVSIYKLLSAKRADRNTRSIIRDIQRRCKRLGMTWEGVIRLARTQTRINSHQ